MSFNNNNKFANNKFSALFVPTASKVAAKGNNNKNNKNKGPYTATRADIIEQRLAAQSHLPRIPTPPRRAEPVREQATTSQQAQLCQMQEELNKLYSDKKDVANMIESLKKAKRTLLGKQREGVTYTAKSNVGVHGQNILYQPKKADYVPDIAVDEYTARLN